MPTDAPLSDALLRRVANGPGVRTIFERIGAHTIADKVDRLASGGDIAAIRLPPLRYEMRARRIKMYRHGGHDQVANLFAERGWLGFERPLPSVFRQAVALGGGAVFDVGANTGFYTLLAARTAPRQPIYAFEPLPSLVHLFESNLALNPRRGHITVVAGAVGDSNGEAKLFVPEPSPAVIETSASLNADFKPDHGEVLMVPVVTLDSYWRAQGSPSVSVVKVDVEGYEHAVLAGAVRLLAEARPIVFFEVLPGSLVDDIERIRADVDYLDVRLGERDAIIGGAITFDHQSWNHALVPAERVDDLVLIARRAGLVPSRI